MEEGVEGEDTVYAPPPPPLVQLRIQNAHESTKSVCIKLCSTAGFVQKLLLSYIFDLGNIFFRKHVEKEARCKSTRAGQQIKFEPKSWKDK